MTEESVTQDDRWARWRDLDPVDIANALILYNWNVDPLDQLKALCGETYGSYREEWVRRYHTGFGALWGTLDEDNQARYMELALENYADEVRRHKQMVKKEAQGLTV